MFSQSRLRRLCQGIAAGALLALAAAATAQEPADGGATHPPEADQRPGASAAHPQAGETMGRQGTGHSRGMDGHGGRQGRGHSGGMTGHGGGQHGMGHMMGRGMGHAGETMGHDQGRRQGEMGLEQVPVFGQLHRLELTEAQRRQIAPVVGQFAQQRWQTQGLLMEARQALRDALAPEVPDPKAVEQAFERVCALQRDATVARITAINQVHAALTPAQRGQLRALVQARQTQGGGAPQAGVAAGQGGAENHDAHH